MSSVLAVPVLLLATLAGADPPAPGDRTGIGYLASIDGEVSVDSGQGPVPAQAGQPVFTKDHIITGAGASAQLAIDVPDEVQADVIIEEGTDLWLEWEEHSPTGLWAKIADAGGAMIRAIKNWVGIDPAAGRQKACPTKTVYAVRRMDVLPGAIKGLKPGELLLLEALLAAVPAEFRLPMTVYTVLDGEVTCTSPGGSLEGQRVGQARTLTMVELPPQLQLPPLAVAEGWADQQVIGGYLNSLVTYPVPLRPDQQQWLPQVFGVHVAGLPTDAGASERRLDVRLVTDILRNSPGVRPEGLARGADLLAEAGLFGAAQDAYGKAAAAEPEQPSELLMKQAGIAFLRGDRARARELLDISYRLAQPEGEQATRVREAIEWVQNAPPEVRIEQQDLRGHGLERTPEGGPD